MLARHGTPRRGDRVLLYHGAVCPACLFIPQPSKPDPRWMPGTVRFVDSPEEAAARREQRTFYVAYDYTTHKGHYWRHMQSFRRWLKRVPVASNEWAPLRVFAAGQGYFAEAEDAPDEPEHAPWCIACQNARKYHHKRTSASSSLNSEDEEEYAIEEPVEFPLPLPDADPLPMASLSSMPTVLVAETPPQPLSFEEEGDGQFNVPETPPMEQQNVALSEPEVKPWKELLEGASEVDWGRDTVAAVIGLFAASQPSCALLASVRCVLELRRAGFVQDCECASRLSELQTA